MVRFIMGDNKIRPTCLPGIYIPIWLDLLYSKRILLSTRIQNLHSNMVRFIIISYLIQSSAIRQFTFQYGQIYYQFLVWHNNIVNAIYIPIWLDLLSCLKQSICLNFSVFTFQYGQIYYYCCEFSSLYDFTIYIPIWLDLLLLLLLKSSNFNLIFTFQYGQIYY